MHSGQCGTTGVVAANACYKHVLTTLLVHAVEAQVQDFLTAHMHLQTVAGVRYVIATARTRNPGLDRAGCNAPHKGARPRESRPGALATYLVWFSVVV